LKQLLNVNHHVLRIGLGTDFHQLVEGRKLWLVALKFHIIKGASVTVMLMYYCTPSVMHAGALNLGDIGIHFPDTDASLKDIDSKILLRKLFR
jgi:2-C-methyl-D-erythritol 2,4-cyclodiphosphate synthase